MVAGEQFWRSTGISVALGVSPSFFGVIRGLILIKFGDMIKHKASPLAIGQNSSFAADTFRHQYPAHTRGPNHAGRMKLHEFHVNQFGPCVVGK